MNRESSKVGRAHVVTPMVLAVFCLGLSLTAWSWWPWLYGAVALAALRLLRSRHWVGEGWTVAAALAVVLIALLQRVTPWVTGVVAGLLLAGVAGLVWHRRRVVPRRAAAAGIAAGVVLAAASTIVLAVTDWQEDAQRERAEEIAREERMARAMPRTPQALVHRFVGDIADADVSGVCLWRLSPEARKQFTEAQGAADCPAAVQAMHARIRDVGSYTSVWPPAEIFQPRTGPRVRADACRLEWGSVFTSTPNRPPGPQLGALVMERQHGLGYQVVEYRPC